MSKTCYTLLFLFFLYSNHCLNILDTVSLYWPIFPDKLHNLLDLSPFRINIFGYGLLSLSCVKYINKLRNIYVPVMRNLLSLKFSTKCSMLFSFNRCMDINIKWVEHTSLLAKGNLISWELRVQSKYQNHYVIWKEKMVGIRQDYSSFSFFFFPHETIDLWV